MKKYATAAERQRAYRERAKAAGKQRPSRSKALTGFFVAWDGEGHNTGEIAGDWGGGTFASHNMTLFGCGGPNPQQIANPAGLSSVELLTFIGARMKEYGSQAIHVAFAFGYDTTHILRDAEPSEIIRGTSGGRAFGRLGRFVFRYRPRHSLWIGELGRSMYRTNARGARELNLKWSGTIWDTWGFFQTGFAAALRLWQVGSPSEHKIIIAGKEGRAEDRLDSAELRAYNALEIDLLERLMDKLRAALLAQNIRLRRWDGAGAIASALLAQHKVNVGDVDEEMAEIASYAFAGGRTECVMQGTLEGPVWRADINSAYPSALSVCPDWRAGQWVKPPSTERITAYGLYLIEWDATESSDPFLPFFYRDIRGSIYFPRKGENWIWGAELLAARLGQGIKIKILDARHWLPNDPNNIPFQFAFVRDLYTRREQIKNEVARGDNSNRGEGLIIKLGLNALYGKLCQRDGYAGQRPPYENVLTASFVTAIVRASLYRFAIAYRGNVISMATDGLVIRGSPDIASSSELGGWSVDTFSGVVSLNAGIYWLKQGPSWLEKSSGLEHSGPTAQRMRDVLAGWQTRQHHLDVLLRRFVGIRQAATDSTLWALRGAWGNIPRELKLYDAGNKREPTPAGARLHQRLYETAIAEPPDGGGMSEPRNRKFIDIDSIED